MPTTGPSIPRDVIDSGPCRPPIAQFAEMPLPGAPPAVVLRLSLFGQMRAIGPDGQDLLPGGRKTRGLLALLALAGNRPVLRTRLAGLLWSRRPDAQARASLRQEIHRLMEALSPHGAAMMEIGRHALCLRSDVVEVDAHQLLATEALDDVPLDPGAGILLAELNGIDPALDIWLAGERRRVEEHRRGLYEALLARQADPEDAKAVARRLIALDPLHEAAWRGLITAQTALGEHGAALQSLDRCAAVFHDHLGEQAADAQPLLQRLHTVLEEAGAAAEGAAAQLQAEPTGEAPRAARGDADAPARNTATSVWAPVSNTVATAETGTFGLARLIVKPLDDAGRPDLPRSFSQGLGASLSQALGRAPLLTVIAPGNHLASRAVGGGGGGGGAAADYVVEATMQAPPAVPGTKRRLRVTLRALDIRAQGRLVWSEHFDREGDDLLAFQDDVGRDLAARLPPALLRHETRRAAAENGSSASSLVLRAIACMPRCDAQALAQADALLADAERQGHYMAGTTRALHAVARALWHVVRHGQGLGPESVQEPDRPVDKEHDTSTGTSVATLIERLLDDADNALALALAGLLHTVALGDARAGLVLQDQAVAACPSCSEAHAGAALSLAMLGEGAAALARFERHRALTPAHPSAHLHATGGLLALLMTGREADAATLGRQHAEMHPNALPPLLLCLAALGGLGREAEAARLLPRLRQVASPDMLHTALARLPALPDRIMEGLARTGVAAASVHPAARPVGAARHAS